METSETNLLAIPSVVENEGEEQYLKIEYGYQGTTNIIDVSRSIIEEGFKAIEYSRKSEEFLIEAVRNFIRKINFSELMESLEDEEITEEVFKQTLDQSSDNFTITLRDFSSPSDVLIIADLVQKIGSDLREFTTSEVAEMFSVKENQLIIHVNSLRSQLK